MYVCIHICLGFSSELVDFDMVKSARVRKIIVSYNMTNGLYILVPFRHEALEFLH
jgi:hypothetical protein